MLQCLREGSLAIMAVTVIHQKVRLRVVSEVESVRRAADKNVRKTIMINVGNGDRRLIGFNGRDEIRSPEIAVSIVQVQVISQRRQAVRQFVTPAYNIQVGAAIIVDVSKNRIDALTCSVCDKIGLGG